MFSDRLLFFALGVALLGAAGLVDADSHTGRDGAPEVRKWTLSAGYSAGPQFAASEPSIDRNEIRSMRELVDSLLAVVTRFSTYQTPPTTPAVVRVARADIERTICQGPCPVKAWYLPNEGIFLDADLMPETNLIDRSILLHELVHFLQDINGEGEGMDPCERWLNREREAYALQNRYLALVEDSTSYRLMIGNQTWVATHRNMCRTRESAAGLDSMQSRHVSKQTDHQASGN
jgi:hypothetical protein